MYVSYVKICIILGVYIAPHFPASAEHAVLQFYPLLSVPLNFGLNTVS